jgi:hypothetical protein
MKSVGMTFLAVLALVLSLGADTPPKKYNTGSSHPRHSMERTGDVSHSRSSASPALPSKSQSARAKEVERLEHRNTAHLQAQSRQGNSKASAQAPRTHSQSTGHSSSGINFNYRAPHSQGTKNSSARKH